MKIFLIKKLFDQEESSIVVAAYTDPVKAIAALKEYKDEHAANVRLAAKCKTICRVRNCGYTLQDAKEIMDVMRKMCDKADVVANRQGVCYWVECRNNKTPWYYIDGYRLDRIDITE